MHGAVNLADYMPEPANGCGTLIRFGCFSLPTSCSCPVKHVQYRGRYLFGVERFRILLPNYWFSVSGSEVPHVRRDPYLTNNRMISRRSVFFLRVLSRKGRLQLSKLQSLRGGVRRGSFPRVVVTCLGAIESPGSPIWSVQLLACISHPEVHLQKN